MEILLEYFKDSKDFFILFATFQKNASNSERNLKRLKFEGLGIINGEHISKQIQLRQLNGMASAEKVRRTSHPVTRAACKFHFC